jgi:glucan phosphoethanolaminetransferase (alkaline phosphatase superfamily)
LLFNIYSNIEKSITIEFDYNTTNGNSGELYYDFGYGYSEKRKLSFVYDDTHKVLLKIPVFFVHGIRLDPLTKVGKIKITNMMINHKKVDFLDLNFRKIKNLNLDKRSNTLDIEAISNDSHFILFENIFTDISFKSLDYKHILKNFLLMLVGMIVLIKTILFIKKRDFLMIKNLNHQSIVSSAILISIILFIVDMLIRGFLLRLDLHSFYLYALSFMMTFTILYLIKLSLHTIRVHFVRYIAIALVSLLFTLVYLFQYKLFLLYKNFASPEVIHTMVTDYNYWLTNSYNFLDTLTITMLLVAFLLFFIYFHIVGATKSRYSYKILIIIPLLIPISIYAFKTLKYNKTIFLPMEKFVHATATYIKTRDEFKISKNIVRNKLLIQKKELDFNILLLINESLRDDHLNLFGYEKDTSLNISNFFKNSYNSHAISQTAVTSSSLETIFTGAYATLESKRLPTMWAYMSQLGFETFYFGSQTLSWGGGLDRFFLEKKYIDTIFSPITSNAAVGQDDSVTINAFVEYIQDINRPFFGAIHFNSTHYPYLEHPKYDKFFPISHELDLNEVNELQNAYDNAINYMDLQFKRLVDTLSDNDLLEKTIIFYFSDHAEGFGNHGELFHTRVFWIEGIRTPLMIYVPKGLNSKFKKDELDLLRENSKRYVANVDIFPTILDMLDIDSKNKLDGHSLIKKIKDEYIFSTISPSDSKFTYINRVTGQKFTFDNEKKKVYISNLYKDPKELDYISKELSKTMNRKSASVFIQNYLNKNHD